jgi:Fe2+ or Zn2+ uptake regulation protein
MLRVRVLEYLSEHPQAMDTIDGIAEWWVQRDGESIDRKELRNVLHLLRAEGILEKLDSGSGTRFSLCKSRKTPPTKM